MFLVLIDAYSKWLEVLKVNSTSTDVTIAKLRQIFATHGLPDHLVSDNGASFISHEFQSFMSRNGIKHTTSSPYHPHTNGLAERAIQTFKLAMKKLKGPIDLNLSQFLLTYRTTPHSTTGLSPAELLLNHKPRTLLDLLHPDVHKKVATKMINCRIHKLERNKDISMLMIMFLQETTQALINGPQELLLQLLVLCHIM